MPARRTPRTDAPDVYTPSAYTFPPEQGGVIIRATAYHRNDFDLAAISFPHFAHTSVATWLLCEYREPTATLGAVDRLPVELINEIRLELDILSLFRFRHVNARARRIVHAMYEYRIIPTHALNAFCALLRTGAAVRVTLSQFYDLFCTTKCSDSGQRYGNPVFLLPWARLCSFCVQERVVLELCTVRRSVLLSEPALGKFPTFISLSGIYVLNQKCLKCRAVMTELDAAKSAYRYENEGKELPLAFLQFYKARDINAWQACCALPSYSPTTGEVEYGLSCAGCQINADAPHDRQNRTRFHLREAVYKKKEYLGHFARCRQAQSLWLANNKGSNIFADWPDFCLKGAFMDAEHLLPRS